MKLFFVLLFHFPLLVLSQTKTLLYYDPSKYVLVNPALIRGEIDYATFSIAGKDNYPPRAAAGVRLRSEARLISGFMEKEEKRFFIYDAFYIDLSMGKMNSKPYQTGTDKEDAFAYMVSMGYDIYAGYRNENFGVLAGKKFNWNSARIGMTSGPADGSLFYRLTPWAVRLEYCLGFNYEFRLVLSAWNSFNKNRKNSGIKLDVPIHPKKRFFLTAEYNYWSSLVESFYLPGSNQYRSGISQFALGFRVGSIY